MAGNKIGGQKAKQANLARDPDFYATIGAKGGRNGHTGGFAAMIPCYCDDIKQTHHKAQCSGKRGGTISRRGKSNNTIVTGI